MKILNNYIKGDRYLWAFISILSIFSFLPVYSASTNLILINNRFTVFYYLFRHIFFLIIGFIILFFTQFIDYKYIGGLAVLAMPITFILLIFTLLQGNNINSYTAARWINIGFSFQTSTISTIILLIYCARFMAAEKRKNKKINFFNSFFKLKIPIILNIALIFPANASTAIILFILVISLLFIGDYPVKYLLILILLILFFFSLFIFIGLNFSQGPINRVYTWKNRIKSFFMYNDQYNVQENYQIQRSKAAIILGGKLGRGPGKSALKVFLPQSSSDFIYAIIIEEYGLLGGIIVLFIYILILFRILIIITKLENYFASMLLLALGLPIIFQAFINMAVTVNLLPVTGQTLPLISAGGTSIWINFFSIGVILNISSIINNNNINNTYINKK